MIQFDLATVTVDLGAVPMDEILSYRQEHLEAHRRYRVAVRTFANELSRMDERERDDAFTNRQIELDALAADLRSRSRKAWKKPAYSASASRVPPHPCTGNWVGAAIGAAAAALRYERSTVNADGPYSYLVQRPTQIRLPRPVMDRGVEGRRLAIEIIANLVHIKSTMGDLVFTACGVPGEVYRPLLIRRDEGTRPAAVETPDGSLAP